MCMQDTMLCMLCCLLVCPQEVHVSLQRFGPNHDAILLCCMDYYMSILQLTFVNLVYRAIATCA